MKEFNEILDAFLVEIEKNPSRDANEVIIEVASKFKKADNEPLVSNMGDIIESLNCISELYQNINDLNNAKKDGISRKGWMQRRINAKFDKIPFLTDERKCQLFQTILAKVDETLVHYTNKNNWEG